MTIKIPSRLREEIENWIRDKKYGHLQINFAGGKIVNVNRTESIKVDFLGNGSFGSVTVTSVSQDDKLE